MPEQVHTVLPLRLRKQKKYGINTVTQIGEVEREIVLTPAGKVGTGFCFKDQFGRDLLIYPPRVSANEEGYEFKLRSRSSLTQHSDVSSCTDLSWLIHPSDRWPTTAEGVASTWKDQFRFIAETPGASTIGLREPQIGALHAIASHWTMTSRTATVVMPTGTGKTETMMSVMVYAPCNRVLVIVPSDALRLQIFRKFCSLGCLVEIGVIPPATALPLTALLKKSVASVPEIQELARSANVIVSTVSLLNNFDQSVLEALASECTHLFIDEAHHRAAQTWSRVKAAFDSKPVLQFTATPFRRDGKKIDGQIIYNYPLGRAQERGYFRPITMIPVDEIDEDKANEAIASVAVARLEQDLQAGFDHLVLARVSSIEAAEDLVKLYQSFAPEHSPIAVHSQLSTTEQRARLSRLAERTSRILVCVDMFGEGYDLPQLKIAAMHDVHRSLPITLQFVGRFTRTASGVGDASVIVNIADPKVDDELQSLYAQDSDWNNLLRRTSESRIAREVSLQELIDSFQGTLPSQIPLWNLRPGFSTVVFRTGGALWKPERFEDALPACEHRWTATSADKRIAVAVIAKATDVRWGRYRDIKDLAWHLVLSYWSEEQNLLYVYASDYDSVNPMSIAKAVIGDQATLVQGATMFRSFDKVERPMVRNLGASKAGSIRFTMFFGPDVTEGLSQVEKAESEINNLFGWGYEEGERITRGCSVRKGKLWSYTGGPIADWRDWCVLMGGKLLDDTINNHSLIEGFLRPEEIRERPSLVPIAIEFGESLITEPEDRVSFHFGTDEVELDEVRLTIADFSETGPVRFTVSTATHMSQYALQIESSGNSVSARYVHESGPPVAIQRARGEMKSLNEWMLRDPFIVYYVDGSFSYNQFFVKAPCPGQYDRNALAVLDWTGVDIQRESQGKLRDADTIQFKVIQEVKDDFDIVFDDDAAREAADVVCIREEGDEKIIVHLIHCKFSLEANPGARIKDLYEVCGQAQKCVNWKHGGLKKLVEHMLRREKRWEAVRASRFIKGDRRVLRLIEKKARRCRLLLEVTIVQPGLAKSDVTGDILALLGSTELYLKRTANATLRVLCSR